MKTKTQRKSPWTIQIKGGRVITKPKGMTDDDVRALAAGADSVIEAQLGRKLR